MAVVHKILNGLRDADTPAPSITVGGLRLAWDAGEAVAVYRDSDPPDGVAAGYVPASGSFAKTATCKRHAVLALRNFASDPISHVRRRGQDEGCCPLCSEDLEYDDGSSILGYCADCADRLGWPHDRRATWLADFELNCRVWRVLEGQDEGDAQGLSEAG